MPETLSKARKAKGLAKWDKLQPLSERLQGKTAKDITFTCCHPSHATLTRHTLGSSDGNLHFLLGYANPGFHVADYHWQVIDPNATENVERKNPTNPAFWNLEPVGDEGDLVEGKPCAVHAKQSQLKQKEASRTEEAIKVKQATATYTCYPSEQLVVQTQNNHTYSWDLLKDSFFSAQNVEAAQAMNAVGVVKSLNKLTFRQSIPENLRELRTKLKQCDFEEDVWPLVKSRMKPGQILELDTDTGETLYGLVSQSSLSFFSRSGDPALIKAFDRSYDHFDLTLDGNVSPAVLISLLDKHVNLCLDLVKSTMESM